MVRIEGDLDGARNPARRTRLGVGTDGQAGLVCCLLLGAEVRDGIGIIHVGTNLRHSGSSYCESRSLGLRAPNSCGYERLVAFEHTSGRSGDDE